MFYKVEYQKRAHQEVEKIFRVLFPEQGLAVREEQIRLCHEMLDTLLGEQIALCDAGVGIGKTYAYLVACVLLRKYSMLTGIKKLGGDDLKNLSKRMKAVKEADAEYDNYGGKLEEQTGEVRFIIETDGID